MNDALLHTDVQEFIFQYNKDLAKLAFSGSPFSEVSIQELLQQIQSRKAIENKLPSWFSTKGILYPPKLNLEQTSSEITARYKARLCKGSTLADLTGGFGIDAYYFAQVFDKVTHFEANNSLSVMAAHNFKILGQSNITCVSEDAIAGIANSSYDLIYVDPSRRNKSKGKVFFLEDCEPNIPENLNYLLQRAHTVLIKTSPMLDIAVGLKELKQVAELHVVAIKNEVKELLWVLRKNTPPTPQIATINYTSAAIEKFSFNYQTPAKTVYQLPQKYLYEPNPAVMKAGGFQYISAFYGVSKLQQHSHLFTNNTLIDFPGRRFVIEKTVPYTKKDMRAGITFDKANVTIRNFPENVATLRKKWNLKEGGNRYLFFTTLENEDKILLICAKV